MSERGISRLTRMKFGVQFRDALAQATDQIGRLSLADLEEWAWRRRKQDYARGYAAGYRRRRQVDVPCGSKVAS